MPSHQCTRTPCQDRWGFQCSSRSLDSWHRTWCCRTVWCQPCSCTSPDKTCAPCCKVIKYYAMQTRCLQTDRLQCILTRSYHLISQVWLRYLFGISASVEPSFTVLSSVGWQRTKWLRQEIDDGQLHSGEEVLNLRGPFHTNEASAHHQHGGRPFVQALQEIEPEQVTNDNLLLKWHPAGSQVGYEFRYDVIKIIRLVDVYFYLLNDVCVCVCTY